MAKRYFTLQEARSLLPWIAEQFVKLDAAREEENRLQQDTVDVFRNSRSNGKGGMEREIAASQKAVEEAMNKTSALVRGITDRGIIVRDINSGLVDFLALREGQEVFLCWLRGEEDITFWHGVHEGYASRKPL
jgi:hypothetical protein